MNLRKDHYRVPPCPVVAGPVGSKPLCHTRTDSDDDGGGGDRRRKARLPPTGQTLTTRLRCVGVPGPFRRLLRTERAAGGGLALLRGRLLATVQRANVLLSSPRRASFLATQKQTAYGRWNGKRKTADYNVCEREITLSGGSLGSCVDEERSQLREVM